jgi:thiol-disulfide isomerase/thioredoxin
MNLKQQLVAVLAGGLGALALVWACGGPAYAIDDAYDFELVEVASGELLSFEDLTYGMPLVVHVWGPDCPHCRVHMPYAVALYEKLDLSEVNYFTLSLTGAEDEITDYLEERELDLPVLWGESGEYGEGYEEEGWPTTFVFAPGGDFVGWCDILGPAYVTQMLDLIEQAKGAGYAESTLGLDALRYARSRAE